MVTRSKRLTFNIDDIGKVLKLGENLYLLLESVKCERCNEVFFKQISYDGKIQDYKLCPFCHSAYWNLPRTRKIYEKKGYHYPYENPKPKKQKENPLIKTSRTGGKK